MEIIISFRQTKINKKESEMSWLFIEKDHSESYSKYRPTYPSSVYNLMLDKLEQSFACLPQNKLGEKGAF